MAVKPKTKPLAHMKNTAKGTIDHIRITPAKNSRGGMGFITHIHRNRPAAQQAAMDAGGPYQAPPEPEQTIHEDGQDMMDHVGKAAGVQPEPPDTDDLDGGD